MKWIVLGLFHVFFHALTAAQIEMEVHHFVNASVTCNMAWRFCTNFYKSLSIVAKFTDLQKLEEAAGGKYNSSWINNIENTCKLLKYEDTKAQNISFLFQSSSDCAFALDVRWKTVSCYNYNSFFCYERFVLVQEKKTWEEALEHCRIHYKDLASLNFPWPGNQIKNETKNSQTENVWTGLRFLNGNWFWLKVGRVPKIFLLPTCPAEPYRCGARNLKDDQWENRDCEEKLNFICLS